MERKAGCNYGGKNNRLQKLRDDEENQQMYRRGVVLDGLLLDGSYFIVYMFKDSASAYSYTPGDRRHLTEEELEAVLEIFEKEQVPVPYQLALLSCLHESCYSWSSDEAQNAMQEVCVAVLDKRIGKWGDAYRESALEGPAMTRIFCIRTMDMHFAEYKEAILACAGDGSKQVQEYLLSVYKSHREWEPDIKAMLEGKQKERFMAARVLVRLNTALMTEVYDECGKRLKNMPVPGKNDDAEKAVAANKAYKDMKKQLKTVSENQKMRFSQALMSRRLWQAQDWKRLFVKNAVMHQFAAGMIWGIYEDGILKETFRYMEDGSFNTSQEEEYIFPQNGTVGLVHPLELNEEELAAWKEQLTDYEVIQPICQLDRPVYRPVAEEQASVYLTRFQGKTLNGLTLSGRLIRSGWFKGPAWDGGEYRSFYREDNGIGAELEFSGCGFPYEDRDVVVYGLSFYDAETGKENDKKQRYMLGEVDERYFSEIVLQIAEAVEV